MFGNLSLTSEFTRLLSKHTTLTVDLHYIKHSGLIDRSQGGRITIATDIQLTQVREILFQENAIYKNSDKSKYRENVYFSWSRSNTQFNIAFVDDITLVNQFRYKNHFCLVQTSESKYQAYFLLNKYVNSEELYKIQKVLCSLYHGDVGALSTWQLKRVPGFFNTKYTPNFLVKVVFTGTNIIDSDEILEYYRKKFEKPVYTYTYVPNIRLNTRLKSWQDFYRESKTKNNSSVDMSYTIYLVRKGFSDAEIAEKLKEESPNLELRKKTDKHLEEYIRNTIEKAHKYTGK